MSIDGSETRAEIEEALGHQVYRSKRCFQKVGTKDQPTDWDKAHERIDNMLDARDRTAALV